MLKRRRSVIGVDDVTGLIVSFGDPFGEFEGVGDGGGEEDVVDFVREEDDGFFPDYSTFCGKAREKETKISELVDGANEDRDRERRESEGESKRTLVPHVVDLIVDDPGDFSHDLGSSVEHRSEDLREEGKRRSFEVSFKVELETKEGELSSPR